MSGIIGSKGFSRRHFLQGTTALALATLCPLRSSAATSSNPFELSSELQKLARASGKAVLDAGTGNPNFLHVTARRAHIQLYQAALNLAGPSGMRPVREDLGQALNQALTGMDDTGLAKTILTKAQEVSGLNPDEVADQLLQMLLGTTYAGFQPLAGSSALAYQKQEMKADGSWHFFPTQGASEGLELIFERFKAEGVLGRGRALMEVVPTFSPFDLSPELRGDFEIRSLPLQPPEWELSSSALDKLLDPAVKVLYLVDPGNPVPTALDSESVSRLVELVRDKRRDLIILADGVYGCFPDVWHPVVSQIPRNCVGIGSWSKHFGATGWRLGCVMLHSDSVLKEYSNRSLESFIKPAHLTLPQQGMMTVFSLTQLTDWGREYDRHIRDILDRRWRALYRGLGMAAPDSPRYSRFYGAISLAGVARANSLKPWPESRETEFVRRLASEHGAVCLLISGFSGPLGMLRISLASLDDAQAERLGRGVVDVLRATTPSRT